MKSKKIIVFVLIGILCCICVCNIISVCRTLFLYIEELNLIQAIDENQDSSNFFKQAIIITIREFFFPVILLIICITQFVVMLKKTNFANSVRYTYEQFKQNKKEKQKQKNQAKKDKLRKQLNELEKD